MANAQLDVACFETPFLTIIGDCDNTSSSGVVLNNLHGVTLRNAANITNEEFKTGIAMLREFEIEAINAVVRDVVFGLGSKYRFNKIRHSDVIGALERDDFVANADTVGFELRMSETAPVGSKIHLEYLEFSVGEQFNLADIVITTDNTDTVIQKTLYPNQRNTVYVDKYAETYLRVVYAPVGLIGNSNIVSNTVDWHGDCQCRYTCGNCFVATNIEIDTGNPVQSAKPNGIRAGINCTVAFDQWLCKYKNDLAYPIRLMVGIMVMNELLTSTRVNPLVRNSRDDAERLLTMWRGGVDVTTGFEMKSEYWKLLSPIIKMIANDISKSGHKDFECNGMSVVTCLP